MTTILPSSVPQLAQSTYAALPNAAAVRMGEIAELHPTHVMVRITGALTSTEAGWVNSYEPVLGDVVAVSRQGATWVVLGALGSVITDSTRVPNYSFEEGVPGNPPPQWTLSITAGSPTFTNFTYNRDDPIDGPQVGALTAPSSGVVTVDVVSDPISVNPGEQWAVAAWCRTLTAFGLSTGCSLEVLASWYSTTALGSIISSASSGSYPIVRAMGWTCLHSQGTGGRVAPLGANWLRLRVAVQWTAATAGDTIYFDRMIARRV